MVQISIKKKNQEKFINGRSLNEVLKEGSPTIRAEELEFVFNNLSSSEDLRQIIIDLKSRPIEPVRILILLMKVLSIDLRDATELYSEVE